MTHAPVILTLDLPGIPLFKQGKVRNVYDLGDKLLFVVTDRISAFDVVMKNGIPGKGKVLNMISLFWFDLVKDIIDNHVITADIEKMVKMEPRLGKYREILEGRSMLVKKAETMPVECIVRGYISGSGWKDYDRTGKVCGIELPRGLRESDKLSSPIFTPSTKADTGHDENISVDEMVKKVGKEAADFLIQKSVAVYERARDHAAARGIIIADTKFEFGRIGDKIIIIDEVLTPDSSRFWPVSDYAPGRSQKSFDKQFVRDYLEILKWDKTPPGPELPPQIVQKTSEKYLEAYRILTGKELVI